MELLGRIEALLRELESASDPVLRENARELVQTLMDFHGDGLRRMFELLRGRERGEEIVSSLAADEAVSNLLLLYDLHPQSLETRVANVVSRMSGVELVSVSDGVVRLRVRRAHNIPAVEDAIYAAAPDALAIKVEDAGESAGFVPLEHLLRS